MLSPAHVISRSPAISDSTHLADIALLGSEEDGSTSMVRTFKHPAVPFVEYLNTDWIQKITIKGRAPHHASRFTIYLQQGSESEPHEVAFVFDARFNYSSDHNKIVTNYKKGEWGTESGRECHFPFRHNEQFKIKINVDDDCFKVKVNGDHLLKYHQKVSMKKINCIRIQNDVILEEVQLE